MGWFLCVYTIFQFYALYLRSTARAAGVVATRAERKNDWHQITALDGALILEFLSVAALARNVALVSIFSMLFVTVLCFVKVQASQHLR